MKKCELETRWGELIEQITYKLRRQNRCSLLFAEISRMYLPNHQRWDFTGSGCNAMNDLLAQKDIFLVVLKENIAAVLNEECDKSTKDIDKKLDEFQKELLRLANSMANYEEVADEIYRLRELKQRALVENAEREWKRQRIIEMDGFLDEQPEKLEVYDEQLVRRLIEKVTVFEEKFTVEFKSGMKVKYDLRSLIYNNYSYRNFCFDREEEVGWNQWFINFKSKSKNDLCSPKLWFGRTSL